MDSKLTSDDLKGIIEVAPPDATDLQDTKWASAAPDTILSLTPIGPASPICVTFDQVQGQLRLRPGLSSKFLDRMEQAIHEERKRQDKDYQSWLNWLELAAERKHYLATH